MYKFPFSTFASVFYSVSLEWSSEKCIIIRHPPTPMTLISELHFFFYTLSYGIPQAVTAFQDLPASTASVFGL